MSVNKPSYAAVVASTPETGAAGSSTSTPAQHDAPPPYHGPADHKAAPPAPQHVAIPQRDYYTPEAWSPPSNEHVARARTNRRFIVSLLWGFGIWLLIGMLLGGGISDVNSTRGHGHGHWNKHGEWREDRH